MTIMDRTMTNIDIEITNMEPTMKKHGPSNEKI